MTEEFGGWGPIQPATPEVQDLCNKVLPQIVKKVAVNLQDVRALKFRQIVEGQNFRILAKSGEHYLSVYLYVPLDLNVPELTGAEFLPTA
ncbi:hypothetical protein AAFF_G00365220 [Aldrovandia affinis]|uniref:Cystatin domain-containing protein n=1 Tax=Aldrovandia affinis TaxID=143900 RepID=A0AAD7R554_9TELE|nr:hypothetical protein AAFF_G00365220 [Aldrovandia affinis]